jgi:hypothetical protein
MLGSAREFSIELENPTPSSLLSLLKKSKAFWPFRSLRRFWKETCAKVNEILEKLCSVACKNDTESVRANHKGCREGDVR